MDLHLRVRRWLRSTGSERFGSGRNPETADCGGLPASRCSHPAADSRCVWRTRAARTCVIVALATPALQHEAMAAPEVSQESRAHFRAGVILLQDPDGARYEEAYREFKAAYAISPSPKMLGNIAYCAFKLERDEEAIVAYERYLKEATDIEPGERTQVEADLLTLRSGIVRLEVTVPTPGGTLIDKRVPAKGDAITNLYEVPAGKIVVAVRQGQHAMTLRLPKGETAAWTLAATPGGKYAHTFEPPVEPRIQSNAQVGPWVVIGTGALLLAGGGVTGYFAYQGSKKIEGDCPNSVCPSGYGLDSERARTSQLVQATDVLLVAGGVVAVGGLAWLFLSPKEKGTTSASFRPTGACGPTGCSAFVTKAF